VKSESQEVATPAQYNHNDERLMNFFRVKEKRITQRPHLKMPKVQNF
jgi:hypothetical protein